MAIDRSDNRYERHPKPTQEGERKLSGGAYVDYDSEADVIANTVASYRRNKYYWIAGVLNQCDDDGTTFRKVGGDPGITDLKFVINSDGSGTPDATFDAYKPTGTHLADNRFYGKVIIMIVWNSVVYTAFNPVAANNVPLTTIAPDNVFLDFTNVGSLGINDTVVVLMK